MAGRHAFTPEVAKNAINSPTGRGMAAAAVVGTMFGVALPAAHADTTDSSVAQPVVAATLATAAVTAPSDAEWKITQVSVDTHVEKAADVALDVSVTLPVAPEPEPAAVTVADVQTTQATTTRTEVATTEAIAPAVDYSSLPASNSAVVNIARQYIGAPYVWGTAGPSSFDCSGFTSYVFAQVGISLSRSSSAQRYAGTVIPASEAQPGDLLWWPGHVGIYTGNGQHIAARNPSVGVQEGPVYGSPIYIRL